MKPIAIAIADLHLSLLQPVCRADKDWMGVQAHYLKQVRDLSHSLNRIQPLPVLCAGDIFDRWNAPPELINFALEHLPNGMLCVPGQHDLPMHRMEEMHRCGYGVLKRVGKIHDISGRVEGWEGAYVHGFGWGQRILPFDGKGGYLHIALIHEYCWVKDKSYPGAPEGCHLSTFTSSLAGYDVAVFGDNHKGFLADLVESETKVINCGGLIRRKSDEIDYQPKVGILYDDGSVQRHRLDTSIDKFHEDAAERKEVPLNMAEFIEGLEALGEHGLNFREAVENHLRTEEVEERTKEIILRALEQT